MQVCPRFKVLSQNQNIFICCSDLDLNLFRTFFTKFQVHFIIQTTTAKYQSWSWTSQTCRLLGPAKISEHATREEELRSCSDPALQTPNQGCQPVQKSTSGKLYGNSRIRTRWTDPRTPKTILLGENIFTNTVYTCLECDKYSLTEYGRSKDNFIFDNFHRNITLNG